MMRSSLNEASYQLRLKLQALSSRRLELAISWVPSRVRTLVEIEVPIGKVMILIRIRRFSDRECFNPNNLHRHDLTLHAERRHKLSHDLSHEQVLPFRVQIIISELDRTVRIRAMQLPDTWCNGSSLLLFHPEELPCFRLLLRSQFKILKVFRVNLVPQIFNLKFNVRLRTVL